MVKRSIKVVLFWVSALYVVIALSFGFGYSTQISSSSKDDPTVTVEDVLAGLSWPWFVVQIVSRPS